MNGITIALDDNERDMLVQAIRMWRGPTRMTEPLAIALWFDGALDFERQLARLEKSLTMRAALDARDWHRVVAMAEIAFASWVLGAAGDWDIVSGMDDHATLDRLRAVQRKVAPVRPWPEPYGRPGHTGESAPHGAAGS